MLEQILILVLLFDMLGPMIDPLSPIKDPFNPYNQMRQQPNNYDNNTESNPNNTNLECEVSWWIFRDCHEINSTKHK